MTSQLSTSYCYTCSITLILFRYLLNFVCWKPSTHWILSKIPWQLAWLFLKYGVNTANRLQLGCDLLDPPWWISSESSWRARWFTQSNFFYWSCCMCKTMMVSSLCNIQLYPPLVSHRDFSWTTSCWYYGDPGIVFNLIAVRVHLSQSRATPHSSFILEGLSSLLGDYFTPSDEPNLRPQNEHPVAPSIEPKIPRGLTPTAQFRQSSSLYSHQWRASRPFLAILTALHSSVHDAPRIWWVHTSSILGQLTTGYFSNYQKSTRISHVVMFVWILSRLGMLLAIIWFNFFRRLSFWKTGIWARREV